MQPRTFFEDIKHYVGFTDASSALLLAFHPTAEPHFEAIVDDFYATIEANSGALAAISGGRDQIERLKKTLVRWLDVLLLGPHDEAYFQLRARIGRVHVRIELPQHYMLTAMNRIRVQLIDIAHTNTLDTKKAIHQILDLELAIMLETYREDLVAKMRGAERLATIGQFAAGIGHELRNPLGVIESSAFLLRQHLGQDAAPESKVGRHLTKIETEVKRSNKTITDLLELARNRAPNRRTVDASSLCTTAIELAGLPPAVTVEVDVPTGLTMDADPDQLAVVVSNLLVNAGQAMEDRGRVRVSARRDEREAVIRVADDGPGVPPDARARIFEPLFTTKAKGSGLGLALARRITEAHGGTLTLEPSVRGAVFVLAIPDARSAS